MSRNPKCQVDEDGPCPFMGRRVVIGETAGFPCVLWLCGWHSRMIEVRGGLEERELAAIGAVGQ